MARWSASWFGSLYREGSLLGEFFERVEVWIRGGDIFEWGQVRGYFVLKLGEYVNSVADGYGEYYWSDKSVYKGDFKQGVRHGYGIWQDDNEIYKGNYRLDRKEGLGIYVWKNKQIYKGEFKDDFREGYGEFYSVVNHSEKLIYKGCWVRGKKNE